MLPPCSRHRRMLRSAEGGWVVVSASRWRGGLFLIGKLLGYYPFMLLRIYRGVVGDCGCSHDQCMIAGVYRMYLIPASSTFNWRESVHTVINEWSVSHLYMNRTLPQIASPRQTVASNLSGTLSHSGEGVIGLGPRGVSLSLESRMACS